LFRNFSLNLSIVIIWLGAGKHLDGQILNVKIIARVLALVSQNIQFRIFCIVFLEKYTQGVSSRNIMQHKLPQLGPIETQLFAWIQLQDRNVVKAGEFAKVMSLTAKQESKLYSRLCRAKLAIRLMRGIYLLPSKIPPGGNWGPNPYWVLDKLMNAIKAKYQIAGRAAFNRYGFSEQVANQIAVYGCW
jgi:hypothetical protein